MHPLQTRCFLPCGPSGSHTEAPGSLLQPLPPGQGRVAALMKRPGAESPPCHVVAVGPCKHPLPCFIPICKMNLIPEPTL